MGIKKVIGKAATILMLLSTLTSSVLAAIKGIKDANTK